MFADSHQPIWQLADDEDRRHHLFTPIHVTNAPVDTTPTLCANCGTEIRPYGGERYKHDLCPPCFEHFRFEAAASANVAAAIKAR